MRYAKKAILYLSAVLIFVLWAPVALAESPSPDDQAQKETDFVYTVQPGDTLAVIASRYNLTPEDIMAANNLANPDLILAGQRLILPGVILQGTPAADTPAGSITIKAQHVVQPGETLFVIANRYGISFDSLILANSLPNPDVLEIGQILVIPGNSASTLPVSWPAPFASIQLSEPEIIQGRTLLVRASLSGPDLSLTGTFEGQPLIFTEDNRPATGQLSYWSMVPIYALAEPGTYPLMLTATISSTAQVTTTVEVTIAEGAYPQENIQLSQEREDLLEPELLRQEREKLNYLWSQVSPRQLWAGPFLYPVQTNTWRLTSVFGTRRSYNGGESVSGFHEGLDFGGSNGAAIYAPAAGRVVLAESLAVRGNAVLIDHGLGLFSGYWHQSQAVVREGQEVQAGDLIGYVGDTGLATGPHLHWEMRLNGVAVEPLQWIQQVIP